MITKTRLILILGIWIAVIPFLGFPSSVESFLVIASGVLVAIVSFLHARDRRRKEIASLSSSSKEEVLTETFADNGPRMTT